MTKQGVVILNDSWTADAAAIVSARPDMVIAAVPYQGKAISEILRAGVRLLALSPCTLEDIYGDIASIAGVVGISQQGSELIASMQSRIEAVRSYTLGLPRPRVFCEEWGKPLIASQPWVAELVEAAGGQFLGQSGRQIECGEVARLNPDVVIAAWCGAGNRVPLEKITVQRHWENVGAVRTGSVFCIPDEYLNTPSPSLLRGLEALAGCIHPELFPLPSGVRRMAAQSSPTLV